MFCSINLYLEIRNQKWLYKFSSLFTFSSNIQSNIDPLLASEDQSIFHQYFSFSGKDTVEHTRYDQTIDNEYDKEDE